MKGDAEEFYHRATGIRWRPFDAVLFTPRYFIRSGNRTVSRKNATHTLNQQSNKHIGVHYEKINHPNICAYALFGHSRSTKQ